MVRWRQGGEIYLGVLDLPLNSLAADRVRPLAGISDASKWLDACRLRHEPPLQSCEALAGPEEAGDLAREWLAPVTPSEVWIGAPASEGGEPGSLPDADAVLRWVVPGRLLASPGEYVGLRRDATRHVPYPALAIIVDEHGTVFGYCAAVSLVATDLLERAPFAPLSAVYHHAVALAPSLVVDSDFDVGPVSARVEVWRRGSVVLDSVVCHRSVANQLTRLLRTVRTGCGTDRWTAVLLSLVWSVPASFALEDGDRLKVSLDGIGALEHSVRVVDEGWADVLAARNGVLRIHAGDNVVVALDALGAGATVVVDGGPLVIREDVRVGHKVATVPIRSGEAVIKYGEVIGEAVRSIQPGQVVHTANLASRRGRGDLANQARTGDSNE